MNHPFLVQDLFDLYKAIDQLTVIDGKETTVVPLQYISEELDTIAGDLTNIKYRDSLFDLSEDELIERVVQGYDRKTTALTTTIEGTPYMVYNNRKVWLIRASNLDHAWEKAKNEIQDESNIIIREIDEVYISSTI